MNMEITYSKQGEQMIPNLTMEGQPQEKIGKYGRIRKAFLQSHRKGLYNQLLLSGALTEHLIETDRKAREIVRMTIEAEKQKYGVTEEMKACNQMGWMGLMNNLKQAAEETVLHDLIFI
ncbi:MAG: TnpV protein [Christensenella sp.]